MSYYFRIPHSISHLQKITQSCQYCPITKSQSPTEIFLNYCLICSKVYCNKCTHKKLHGKNKAYVDGAVGTFIFVGKDGKQYDKKIYYNTYM